MLIPGSLVSIGVCKAFNQLGTFRQAHIQFSDCGCISFYNILIRGTDSVFYCCSEIFQEAFFCGTHKGYRVTSIEDLLY